MIFVIASLAPPKIIPSQAREQDKVDEVGLSCLFAESHSTERLPRRELHIGATVAVRQSGGRPNIEREGPAELTKITCVSSAVFLGRRRKMGRGILLWLLGVPIPIIILLALLWH